MLRVMVSRFCSDFAIISLYFDKLKRLCSFSTFQALFLDFKITPTLSGNFSGNFEEF